MKCHVLSCSVLRKPRSFLASAFPIRRPGLRSGASCGKDGVRASRSRIAAVQRPGRGVGGVLLIGAPCPFRSPRRRLAGRVSLNVLRVRACACPPARLPARARRRTHFSREFWTESSEARDAASASALGIILAHFPPSQVSNETKSEYSRSPFHRMGAARADMDGAYIRNLTTGLRGFASSLQRHSRPSSRHARTCSGHPCGRPAEAVERDTRNKSGHDVLSDYRNRA